MLDFVLEHIEWFSTAGGTALLVALTVLEKSKNLISSPARSFVRLLKRRKDRIERHEVQKLPPTRYWPDGFPIAMKVQCKKLLKCASADEVANLYRSEDVRGYRHRPNYYGGNTKCPTAVFLEMACHHCNVHVDSTTISIYVDNRSFRGPISQPVLDFEEAFAQGEYPDLDRNS